MKATTIFLIRHGETDWNLLKRVQGHTDIPLNEKGVEQARYLAGELKETVFDAIYASPLLRAYHTAQHLAEENMIVTDPRLKEMSYGMYEGVLWKQLAEQFKFRDVLPLDEKRHFQCHSTAESYSQVYSRAKTCLDEVVLKHAGKTIAVVAHGGLIRSIISELKDLDPQEIFIDNVGYVVLKVEDTRYTPIHYCRVKV